MQQLILTRGVSPSMHSACLDWATSVTAYMTTPTDDVLDHIMEAEERVAAIEAVTTGDALNKMLVILSVPSSFVSEDDRVFMLKTIENLIEQMEGNRQAM